MYFWLPIRTHQNESLEKRLFDVKKLIWSHHSYKLKTEFCQEHTAPNLKDFILLFYFIGNLNCSSVDLAQISFFFPLFFSPQLKLFCILYVMMNTII